MGRTYYQVQIFIMDDDELTRLAYAELVRDAERFKQRQSAEFRATQIKTPLKTNKRFLKNTINSAVIFNRNLDSSGPRKERIKEIPKCIASNETIDLTECDEEEDEAKVPHKKKALVCLQKSTLKQKGINHRFNLTVKTDSIRITLKKKND